MATDGIRSNFHSPLMTLPNELLFDVASHIDSFKDLNAFLRTSRLFHNLFNNLLYRRVVTANDTVREDIVQWVLSNYRTASLTLLLDNGLSVDQKLETDTEEMLVWFCDHWESGSLPSKSPYEIVNLLLEHGADVNATCAFLWTPLHFAVRSSVNRHEDVLLVKRLLDAGANVEAQSYDLRRPLWLAYGWGRDRIGALLLAHGADARFLRRHKDGAKEVQRWVEYCRSTFKNDDFK
jgi:hypothetical protein